MYRELDVPGYGLAVEYSSVTSTMDIAREWVASLENCDSSAIFTAKEQTAGRGRQGRKWISPPGSALMATFVFPCPKPISALGGYSLAAGVGIVSSLLGFTRKLHLKWPNDLISVDVSKGRPSQENAKKVGGILIEVVPKGREHMISLGIGMNVDGVPAELEREAASLAQMASETITVHDALRLISEGLLSAHQDFMNRGFGGVQARWSEHSCFQQDNDFSTYLEIDIGNEVIRGHFHGVTERGSLYVRCAGAIKEIHSGHILYWGKSNDDKR